MSWETSVIEDTISLLEHIAKVTDIDSEGMINEQIKELEIFLTEYKKMEEA